MSDDEYTIRGGNFTIASPQPTDRFLTINGADNEPLVTILRNGTMEYGPNYTPDAAAKVFWETWARWMPRICDCEKRTR